MVTGVWSSSEFKANSKSSSPFGRRSQLLKAIEETLDGLHEMPESHALQSMFFVEQACKAWIDAHPDTCTVPTKGKKMSNRRRAIETLQQQMKAKRQTFYNLSPEEQQRRNVVLSRYETSDKVLEIAPDTKTPGKFVDPRLLKGRAGLHQELLEKTIERAKRLGHDKTDFNTEQLGFLAAKAALKVDAVIDKKNKERCRVEAMRILLAMLGKNRALAQQFETTGIEVVVVPASRPMTDLPEFSSLKDVAISQDGGTARTWNETRGVGGLTVTGDDGKQKMYVAITEENLLGTGVTPAVTAVGGGCYEARYSTTSHEFAHGLHISSAMTPAQKQVITNAFRKKKRVRIDYANSIVIIEDMTVAANQGALDTEFSKEWVDGPRRKNVALPQPKKYWIYKGSDYAKLPNGTHIMYSTNYELQDCYAAFDEREFFAQLVNAYLGANGGTDPYTSRPRHNGEAWVRTNESVEMMQLLDELFSAGAHAHFGQARTDDTNVKDDGVDELTVADYIKLRVGKIKTDKVLKSEMAKRRLAMGYDDDDE